MTSVEQILNFAAKNIPLPIKVLETGTFSTRRIASWMAGYPDSKFDSIDLDGRLQEAIHTELECDGTAKYCTFHTQAPTKFLAAATWADVCFLYPSDLSAGEQEFSLAISTGARIVVLTDYQRRSASACNKGRALGWKQEQVEDYIVLSRK